MIVWLNGTHGVGKTTTAALVQQLIPDSRVFDAEKIGETLMDVHPGLPEADNFQNWPPWRPLVVETARRILDYTGWEKRMGTISGVTKQSLAQLLAGPATTHSVIESLYLRFDVESLATDTNPNKLRKTTH